MIDDVARALELLTRAVALAPGQEEYQLMLAEELVRQIRNSRLEGLIAQGGLRLGTRSSVVTCTSGMPSRSASRPATGASCRRAGPTGSRIRATNRSSEPASQKHDHKGTWCRCGR